ncbi:MAG: AI-2E family transporter [Pedobacter sp.]|nr:MAG: AI-2E family transporter [Pedobacter sp.]
MSIYSYKQRNIIMAAILLVLSLAILYSARTIVGALLSTIVLYTILRPIFLFLVQRLYWKRWIAALSVIFSSLALIMLPFFALSIMVIHKVAEFQNNASQIKISLERIVSLAGPEFNQHYLLDKILQRAEAFIGELFPSVIGGVVDIIVGLIIIYFLLYFMLVQQEEFEEGLLKYAPFGGQNALKFAKELKNITYSNVLGQGLVALVQGTLVGVGFFIFGLSDALFWGTIAIFVSFLPTIGASIILVPAAVIQLVNGNSIVGWGLLLWGAVVIINVDNTIRFLIAKRIANTHPVITIVGVITGIPMFGILGMVFGPLLLSYFILTIRIYETNLAVSKRLEQIKSFVKK